VVHPCFAPCSSNSPSSIKFLFLITNKKKKKKKKKEERNSSHNKEINKSKKTTVPVVEGCEKHTCIDLGVEDDHHSGIQDVPFERRLKLDMDNFHTF
jgi:hypothetical protein